MVLNNLVKSSFIRKSLVRYQGITVRTSDVPFPKSLKNPTRFTLLFTLAGVVGFGAPWLVVMHQMLRPYDYVVD